jgi:hypothetical protein
MDLLHQRLQRAPADLA